MKTIRPYSLKTEPTKKEAAAFWEELFKPLAETIAKGESRELWFKTKFTRESLDPLFRELKLTKPANWKTVVKKLPKEFTVEDIVSNPKVSGVFQEHLPDLHRRVLDRYGYLRAYRIGKRAPIYLGGFYLANKFLSNK